MPNNEQIDLASAELHAPVEVTLAVYMQLPSGKVGAMRATMPPGQIPSRAELNLVLASFTDADGSIPGAPVGARLLSRAEFTGHIIKRETGEAFHMDPAAQFAAVPADIPHAVLVHAIMGAPMSATMEAEYEARGLGRYVGLGDDYEFAWFASKLAALPDAMLMAIYQRVTA